MKIILNNPHHNGDVHLSRGLTKYLSEKGHQVSYRHACNEYLTKDLVPSKKGLFSPFLDPCVYDKTSDSLIINTWFCQPKNVRGNEISLNNLYETLRYSEQKIFEGMSRKDMLPTNYPHEYKKYIGEFPDSKIKVLICNNEVKSKQCENIDRNKIWFDYAARFPEINFFFTNDTWEICRKNKSPNLFYLENFLQPLEDRYGDKTTLPLISKFSENCNLIVGAGSGPYEMTKVRSNLLDPNKVFVSFSTREFDTLSARPWCLANGIWCPDQDLLSTLIIQTERFL